jgi:hypothetical protein
MKIAPDSHPDPLVRGMDPRIRIRIHTKMSLIRNTDRNRPEGDEKEKQKKIQNA